MVKVPSTINRQEFRPPIISKLQFQELEAVGKIKLSSEIRADIQWAIEIYLTEWTAENNAASKKSVDDLYKKLIGQAQKLSNTLREIHLCQKPETCGVSRTLELTLFNLYPDRDEPLFDSFLEVHNIHAATIKAKETHENLFPGKSGPSENLSRRGFIYKLCECFDAAGGRPSAHFQDLKNCRDTPFVRFLYLINSYLPDGIREVDKRLAETAAKIVIPQWRKKNPNSAPV